MTKKEINLDRLKCGIKGCRRWAKYNIQKNWNIYEIDKKGHYELINVRHTDEENDHYCEYHAEKEDII